MGLVEDLVRSLGATKVDATPETLAGYAQDWTEIPGRPPDVVVRAASADDVRATLAVARARKAPVVPVVAGLNLGGLALARHGGIALDLKSMDRILEVDPVNLYAVLEPGVSWQQLHDHLAARHPELRFGYPTAPPYTSIVANCLLDGLVNLSTPHGTTGTWIHGLEAILADGTTVRTGSAALGPVWFSRSPLPDLTGLFLNSQGTTGIVVRLAVALWPRRRLRKRFFVPAHAVGPTFEALRRLAREEVFDDLSAMSWPMGKMVFGVRRPVVRTEGEPLLFLFLDLSADRRRDLDSKDAIAREVLAATGERGAFDDPIDVEDLFRLEPGFRQLAELPADMKFLTDHGGGGLSFVGTYGPVGRWEEGVDRGMAIQAAHGFPPAVLARPMRAGHFGILHFLTTFARQDPVEVERVHRLNLDLADLVVELGFIPYKTPAWFLERVRGRIDPGFLDLLSRVKAAVDPDRLLCPGNWLL